MTKWERNKQQGGSGYEAGTYFTALDVSENLNMVNCAVLLVYTVRVTVYIYVHITFVNI